MAVNKGTVNIVNGRGSFDSGVQRRHVYAQDDGL